MMVMEMIMGLECKRVTCGKGENRKSKRQWTGGEEDPKTSQIYTYIWK
jgi:hypothetical protein